MSSLIAARKLTAAAGTAGPGFPQGSPGTGGLLLGMNGMT
jgi:hypothetical protein